jgi:hypothetical protein
VRRVRAWRPERVLGRVAQKVFRGSLLLRWSADIHLQHFHPRDFVVQQTFQRRESFLARGASADSSNGWPTEARYPALPDASRTTSTFLIDRRWAIPMSFEARPSVLNRSEFLSNGIELKPSFCTRAPIPRLIRCVTLVLVPFLPAVRTIGDANAAYVGFTRRTETRCC